MSALRQALDDDDGEALLALVAAGEASADEVFEALVIERGDQRRDLLRKLIDQGADPNRQLGDLEEPALLIAARTGDVGLYRTLRKLHVSMSARDGLGNNLVHSAALGGQVKILGDALANKSLDPQAKNEAGFSPFMLVLRRATDEPAVQVEAKARKVLEVLLDAGVVPSSEELREARARGFRGLSQRLRAVGVSDPAPEEPPTYDATEPLIEPHVPKVPMPKRRTSTRRLRRKTKRKKKR